VTVHDVNSARFGLTRTLAHRVDVNAFARVFMNGRENVFGLDGGPQGSSLFGFGDIVTGDDVLSAIDHEVVVHAANMTPSMATTPGFVGWIPYGFAQTTLAVPIGQDLVNNDVSFIRAERVVRVENVTGKVEVAILSASVGSTLAEWGDLVSAAIALADSTHSANLADPVRSRPRARWRDDEASYARKILKCKQAIFAGNAYVLCLTTQVLAPGSWDDIETFIALRSHNPTNRAALIRIGGVSLVSGSPGRFVDVDTPTES
jgi:para-aminobenzoate synthetase component 1